MQVTDALNSHFDKLIRSEVRIGQHSWSAFKVCGCTGLVLATLLAMTLVTYLGLSLLIMAAIVLVSVSILLGLTLITKIITGEERIINYHHQVVVLVVTAVLLWLLDQPILPYLDATILGVGLFIACGRVGCLMRGCCYGRPCHWGVCYRAEHAAVGFTPYFIEVRLFPIQAVESLWLFGVVSVGSSLVLIGHAPGGALVWYVVTYSLGRFYFEFMRGDLERPYYWGFSEAQWISLLLMCAVVWAELTSTLTFHPWHIGATAFLGVTVMAGALQNRSQGIASHLLLCPYHIQGIAGAIQLASNLAVERCDVCKQSFTSSNIHIGCTSLGVQISANKIRNTTGYTHHYALSYQNKIMGEETARFLAEFIVRLKHPSGSSEFIKGNQGVFHLLVHVPMTADISQIKSSGPRDGMEPTKLSVRLPRDYKLGFNGWVSI